MTNKSEQWRQDTLSVSKHVESINIVEKPK